MATRPPSLPTLVAGLSLRTQLILIGLVSGLAGGFAAFLLNLALDEVSYPLANPAQTWLRPVFTVLGIVLTVVLMKYVIRDFGAHGVPEVIASVGLRGGRLRFRSAYSHLVGSLITIGSGGSAGPEAPVVISGASIGSNIAGRLHSSDRVRSAVAGSGAAAAIASIFNAPITGIVFTMEVILGEWTPLNLLPVGIASAAGTVVSHLLKGNRIPFAYRAYGVGLRDILASVGLALLAAVVSVAFIRFMRLARRGLRAAFRRDLLIALAGGAAVAALTVVFPAVRGEGYRLVQDLIAGEFEAGLVMVIVLLSAKIAATALTLGAGGAGGVFAPSLVIGSLAGLLFHRALDLAFPGMEFAGPGFFALVGMAGVLSGTLQAPLTSIFLVFEITRGYQAILPLLITAFLSATFVRRVERHSIYHRELVERGLLRRPRTDARVLSDLTVDELLETDLERVPPEMTLADAAAAVTRSKRNYLVVEDPLSSGFLGLLLLDDVKPFLFDPPLLAGILVEEVMRRDLPRIRRDDSLVGILDKFEASGAWSLPVVEDQRFLGLVSKASLLDHYRKELLAQTEI